MKAVLKRLCTSPLATIIFIIAVLALIFQVVHFIEHLLQAGAWVGGYKKLYMSPLGIWAMDSMGRLFTGETPERQALLGFESLHLVGNAVFMIGIVALLFFRRTREVWWAFGVELFHLYEHISLTFSAYYMNKSIGLSTFFGAPVEPYTLLSYRIWWHFIFNLVPSVLVAVAVVKIYKECQKRRLKKR